MNFKTVKERFLKYKNLNQLAKLEHGRNTLILMGILALAFAAYSYSSLDNEKDLVKTKKPQFDGALDKVFATKSDEALIAKQQHQIDELKDLVTSKMNVPEAVEPKADEATQQLVSALSQKLDQLEQENKTINEKLQVALVSNSQTQLASIAVRPPTREEMEAKKHHLIEEEKAHYSKAGLETVHFKYRLKNKEKRTPDNYVWAGTFAEGVLVSGAKGDAGINGSKNMGTVLIRLDSNGIMPNNQQSKLNGCFVIVSTYGDLSDDAVVMHVETLSCAKPNMSFEQKAYGAVYDLDAMQDIRGTSILKTKPLLEYSAAAGIIAGIGQGIANYGSAQSVNAQTGAITTYSNAANFARSGVGGGMEYPANRLSEYIMKIADIYHPVVIARAGRKVSVMFSKGFWIDNAHQTYESGKSIDNEEAQNDSGITTHISRLNSAEKIQGANSSPEVARTENTSSDGAEEQFLKEHAQSNDSLFSINALQGEPNHG